MRTRTLHRLLLACLCLGLGFSGTLPPTPPLTRPVSAGLDVDENIFSQKIAIAAAAPDLPSRAVAVGKSCLGAPYRSGTLDQQMAERLVVNLQEFDCWTFVENCLAISQTAQAGSADFEFFKKQLQQLRYWGGTVDGYGSRIHYFSGWVLQAEKRGLLRDLTHEMGGAARQKEVNYITNHANFYPKLADPAALADLQKSEQRINAHEWFFIPKSKIAAMEHLIREGDIIATTSTKPGLDISHQGFAVRQNGRIHLMHASSEFKRVLVSRWAIPEYMTRNKGQSGIMVFRLQP